MHTLLNAHAIWLQGTKMQACNIYIHVTALLFSATCHRHRSALQTNLSTLSSLTTGRDDSKTVKGSSHLDQEVDTKVHGEKVLVATLFIAGHACLYICSMLNTVAPWR